MGRYDDDRWGANDEPSWGDPVRERREAQIAEARLPGLRRAAAHDLWKISAEGRAYEERQAGLAVVLRDGLVLAVRRSDGELGLPGGKWERDWDHPDVWRTAVRELKEETGIDVWPGHPCEDHKRGLLHYDENVGGFRVSAYLIELDPWTPPSVGERMRNGGYTRPAFVTWDELIAKGPRYADFNRKVQAAVVRYRGWERMHCACGCISDWQHGARRTAVEKGLAKPIPA